MRRCDGRWVFPRIVPGNTSSRLRTPRSPSSSSGLAVAFGAAHHVARSCGALATSRTWTTLSARSSTTGPLAGAVRRVRRRRPFRATPHYEALCCTRRRNDLLATRGLSHTTLQMTHFPITKSYLATAALASRLEDEYDLAAVRCRLNSATLRDVHLQLFSKWVNLYEK